MQVARNFFLSNEKTFSRKIYEVLLSWEIESQLSKDKILEIYMNQIFLGQRAYGFSSAAQIYFGKELKDITIAESAMLAGLPKAPSAYNPVSNFRRAKIRQEYILQRMRDLSYITPEQYQIAMAEELHIRGLGNEFSTRADFPAAQAPDPRDRPAWSVPRYAAHCHELRPGPQPPQTPGSQWPALATALPSDPDPWCR